LTRYADDAIVGFQNRDEAQRFLRELKERLTEFGLELNEQKTKLIEFGRFAMTNRRQRGEGGPETFTFLGFQHVCASNKKGIFTVQRITDGKRKRKKLQAIKQELRRRMHEPVAKTGAWLRSVLNGYYQYHAVPGNLRALKRFGHSRGASVAAGIATPQRPAQAQLDAVSPDLPAMAADAHGCTSLSERSIRRQDPR